MAARGNDVSARAAPGRNVYIYIKGTSDVVAVYIHVLTRIADSATGATPAAHGLWPKRVIPTSLQRLFLHDAPRKIHRCGPSRLRYVNFLTRTRARLYFVVYSALLLLLFQLFL